MRRFSLRTCQCGLEEAVFSLLVDDSEGFECMEDDGVSDLAVGDG